MRKERRLTAAVTFEAIDVSEAQPLVDWERVRADGYKYAYIRATQGVATSDPVGVDRRFVQHIEGALAAEMKVGVYHVFVPKRDPVEQGRFFLKTIEPYLDRIWLPHAIDFEWKDESVSPLDMAERLYTFATYLEDNGDHQPVMYTAAGYWGSNIATTYDDYFGEMPLWVASWGAPPPVLPRCWSDYWLWQYSNSGSVDGVAGKVDLNRSKGFVPAPDPTPPQPVGFKLYTPFPDYIVPAGGQFNAPRSYPFAPNRLQLHEGLDFVDKSTPQGGIVYCGRGGRVVKVGVDARGYGNFCIVDFGAGWSAWFAHFAELNVREGQLVGNGDALGIAGKTGNSTGVHCHLTLTNQVIGLDNYVVRKVVNPEPYLLGWTET